MGRPTFLIINERLKFKLESLLFGVNLEYYTFKYVRFAQEAAETEEQI